MKNSKFWVSNTSYNFSFESNNAGFRKNVIKICSGYNLLGTS